jgi:hypothetical protein
MSRQPIASNTRLPSNPSKLIRVEAVVWSISPVTELNVSR